MNSIFDNGHLGIDLGDDGPSPTDGGNKDGPNQFRPAPVLERARLGRSEGRMDGYVYVNAGSFVIIEVFRSDSPRPSGQEFLGRFKVFGGSESGFVPFSVMHLGLLVDGYLTATANDEETNTSEFSSALAVEPVEELLSLPTVVRDSENF